MVKIIHQLVSDTPWKYGRLNKKRYITIHETDNFNRDADAKAHANLQSNGNARAAAWHWQVDEKEAYQSFTHDFQLWAGGDGEGNGNLNSIHIEICVNSDGDYKRAVKNAVELAKKIARDEGIPYSHIVQHNHWSGKNCPRYLRNGRKGVNWNDFKKMVSDNTYKPPKPETKPEEITKPKWKEVTGNWTGQTLRKGEYGKPVRQLQTRLSNNNPPFYPNKDAKNNGIDNYYGYDTEDAVSRFQSYYGLKLDGLAGKEVYGQLGGKKRSKPTSNKKYVYLPSSAKTWRTYKLNVQPVKKNSDWSLTPERYGGLKYEILDEPYPNVVTIKTGRGKRNIYVGSGTSAVIK